MSKPNPPDLDALLVNTDFVRRVARAVLGPDDRVEDVVQETWMAALRGGPDQPGALRAWLGRVARNLAIKVRRQDAARRRWERAAARPESPPPIDALVEQERARQRLVKAVLALDEPYRMTLLLRYHQGLSARRTAELTGVPVESARTRLKRGVAKLRAQLELEHERRGTSLRGALLTLTTLKPVALTGAAGLSVGALLMKKTVLVVASVLLLGLAVVAVIRLVDSGSEEKEPATRVADVARTVDTGPTLEAQGRRPAGLLAPGAAVPQGAQGPPPLRAPPPPPPPPPAALVERESGEVGKLVVFVSDEQGVAVEGSLVRAVRDGQPDGEAAASPTDRKGRVQLEGLPAGGYWVRAKKVGFTEAARSTDISSAGPARINVTLVRAIAVKGRVVRAADGVPIAGARVSLMRGGSAGGRTVIWSGSAPIHETTTEADGRFRVEGPATKRLTLIATLPGMAQAQTYLPLGGVSEEVVLRLAPGGTIKGLVLTPDGEPCPGASVFVVSADHAELLKNPRMITIPGVGSCWSSVDGPGRAEFQGEGQVQIALRATTDAAGLFEVAHLPLPVRMRVLAQAPSGSRGGSDVLVLDEANPQALGDVSLEPRASLIVRLVGPEGQGAPSGTASIEGVSGNPYGLDFLEPRGERTWSDPLVAISGAIHHFKGLAVGSYTVVVHGSAGSVVRTPVEITAGGKHEVTVSVEAAPVLGGMVVDEQGRPVPGAWLRWGNAVPVADAEGRFQIEGAGNAERILEASSRWHLPTQLKVPEGEEPVRIVLRARPVVTGVLRPPEGGESLRDHLWIVEHSASVYHSRAAVVDRKGTFRYPLNSTDEEVLLLLRPRGAANVLLGPFNLSAGEEGDVGHVQLDLGRTIGGLIVDDEGRPVSGAIVRAWRPALFEPDGGLLGTDQEATTGPDGSFRISHVHRGRVSVGVTHGTHAPTALEEAMEQDVRIVLRLASFIEGIVRGPDGKPLAGMTVVARREMPRYPAPGIRTQTDDHGHYRLGPLAAGEHPLTVYREQEPLDFGIVVLEEGKTTVRDVKLP